jgi:hypothetical protein
MAPLIFDSVRLYFQTSPEQRQRERWPFTQPVRIYPVLPDLEVADVIEGVSQNISLGGIRVRIPTRPPTDHLYLHLHADAHTQDYAILSRIMRVAETDEGFEVGAMFLGGA